MDFLYNYNALPFFTERDLLLKRHVVDYFSFEIRELIRAQNRAFQFIQIEAPTLMPSHFLSPNYTSEDVWFQENQHPLATPENTLVLKPETTASSYLYAEHVLKENSAALPLCVWQASKSYRREQDQTTKHCRFKEFTHLEFQCIYSADSQNDYQTSVIRPLAEAFARLLSLKTRVVVADRLPSYSERTLDIEVWNEDKWMEVCSMSVRNDFSYQPLRKNKPIPCKVLEIATSVERLVYNIQQREAMSVRNIELLI